MSGNGAAGGYDKSAAAAAAASSAFSPIQAAAAGSMLNSSGFASMHSSRNYFYDPLSFPKHHSQVRKRELEFVFCIYKYNFTIAVFQMGFEPKSSSAANCFPNQLISLSQIRNYAHQPSSDLLHSLKEKAGQVSQ